MLPLVLLAALSAFALGSKPPDPVGTLRKAGSYWQDGKHKKALKRLSNLREGELADHVELLRARWLREKGEPEAALEAARAALTHSPPSEVRARIHHEMAQIHREQGDLLSAYRAQRSAWESTLDPDYAASLVEELARAFDEKVLPGDALRLYDRVWQSWPLAERSGPAFERARLLTEATGAPAPLPSKLLARADQLREASRCEEALESLDPLLAMAELDEELRRSARRGHADCLFQLRRYSEAAAAYQKLAELDPKAYDEAIYVARALARDGQTTRAVKKLEAVARKVPPRTHARVQYLMAIMLRDVDAARSRKLLRAVEKQRAARGLSQLARWRLAWSDLTKGKYEAALWWLAPLTQGSQWDVEVQRARYWGAVSKHQLDPERGRAALTELADTLPLSYYGLLAADQLVAGPEIERSFVGEREHGESHPSVRRTGWLLAAGFEPSARDELESWVRGKGLDRTDRLAAARLLHAVGEHLRAVRMVVDGFGGALEQGIDPEWREAWQLAWPRPFDASVRRAVEEFESDPALVYAVMREESTYEPRAESPAGALGLMQIIPPTAERIATSLSVAPLALESLFDPKTNIRFGTYYLKDLLHRFDGSSALAIAAYNAGPEAVNEWRTRDGALRQDAFVESVPYGETRRYLRRVLRSYRVYRLLYGPDGEHAMSAAPQP